VQKSEAEIEMGSSKYPNYDTNRLQRLERTHDFC